MAEEVDWKKMVIITYKKYILFHLDFNFNKKRVSFYIVVHKMEISSYVYSVPNKYWDLLF